MEEEGNVGQNLVAVFDESGLLRNAGDRVTVGHHDPIREIIQRWVGNADSNAQQRGRIRIELYLQTQDTLDVSADYGGVSDA